MVTRAALLATFVLGACSWTSFDDLADSAWVHSHQRPDSDGTDYAFAIASVGTNGPSAGGVLAVVSNESPSYSSVVFDSTGGTKEGANPQQLGDFFISAVNEGTFLISDPASNQIAIVTAAVDQNAIAVANGTPDNLQANSLQARPPMAAVFAGGDVVVIAQDTTGAKTNLFTVAKTPCEAVDESGAPLQAVAAAADATTLWVWTKTGVFFGYPIAEIATCRNTPGGRVTPAASVATSFAPGSGARVHLAGTHFAVLAAHGDQLTTGSVFSVDLTTLALVGQPLSVDGVRSSAVGVLGVAAGATAFVALGLPDQTGGGVRGGRVDLYPFDTATGIVSSAKASELFDAQPESDQQFGRSLAIMAFNDSNILVVGAKSELFAYYRTLLYPETRLQQK
jgi:hypothetical protein